MRGLTNGKLQFGVVTHVNRSQRGGIMHPRDGGNQEIHFNLRNLAGMLNGRNGLQFSNAWPAQARKPKAGDIIAYIGGWPKARGSGEKRLRAFRWTWRCVWLRANNEPMTMRALGAILESLREEVLVSCEKTLALLRRLKQTLPLNFGTADQLINGKTIAALGKFMPAYRRAELRLHQRNLAKQRRTLFAETYAAAAQA